MTHAAAGRGNLAITGAGSSNGGEFAEVRIIGEGTVEGSVACQSARVTGTVAVAGDMASDTIKIIGKLDVAGSCTAESFYVRGAFHVGGLLNAGQITVYLKGPSTAKEIGGTHIYVKSPRLGNLTSKYLTADLIEGDEVRLECTRAQVVRGSQVVIGRGCHIELVEYTGEFRQSPQATVKSYRRMGE